jgi:hypothetical protein
MCASRNDYSRAFVNGLVLEHYRDRQTDLYKYVVQLQKLRASLMEFFNSSVFADEDGISYQPSCFTVKRYIGDDGRNAAGIANLSDRRMTVRIAIPSLKDEAELYLPCGGRERVSAKDGAVQVTLDAQTAAFLIG